MANKRFISTGCGVAFATSNFTAEIQDIRPVSARREPINVSHQASTGAHNFDHAKLVDWGEFEMDIHFNPATIPPIDQPAEAITITFSDSGAATWAFSGFVTSFRSSAPLENKATGTVTVKIDGDVTVTP
jgi:hypothetical protein